MTDKPKEQAKEAQQPKAEAVAPVLDEDDLFEEFHNEEWHAARNDEVEPLWQLDWDDEAVGNDFLGRLKGELAKGKMKE